MQHREEDEEERILLCDDDCEEEPVPPGVQMFSKQKVVQKIVQQKKFNTKEMGTQKEKENYAELLLPLLLLHSLLINGTEHTTYHVQWFRIV